MSKVHEELSILEEILGKYNKIGNEYLFKCPNIKCEHHKKKFSVNIEKNVGKCWICNTSTKNLYRIVRQYGNYEQQKEWKRINNIIEIESFDNIFSAQEIEVEKQIELSLPDDFKTLCTKVITEESLPARRYLTDRGITQSDIYFWKMGYSLSGEYGERVIIPSFDNSGALNYFIGRTWNDKKRKYKNPHTTKNIIFNEIAIDWDSDVVIVEGVFDAIKAKNAVPLLGSTLREDSKLFQKILKNDSRVFIGLDPDAERKSYWLIENLLKYDIETYKIPVPPDRDIGAMSKKEFLEAKQNSVLIKEQDILLNQIMGI